MLDECFRAAGAEPIVCAEMNTIAPMLELVAQTRIAAIVAADVVRPPMDLCVVPLASPTPMRSFSAIVRKLAVKRAATKGTT